MESKDWIGNANSIYVTMGASNHSELEREKNDFYATEPKAIELLLELEEFNKNIWECACGEGHLSKVLSDSGYEVLSTDLIDRGYGKGNIDFLKCNKRFNGDIITNPPYKYAKEFILKALELVGEGDKVAMFLKVQFLEGKARKELFKNNPPKKVYVSSSRLNCAKNGEFEKYPSSAIAYAWFVWEKGYKGKTIVEWFN
ncbi:NAD(P)-dependent oxidoreductase [Clostridium baratii]|uniref:NAD(P)-dependent oxidoreductase n=1 Tax=Clostridium baratii TaxID=1561 RepID=UPI0030CF9ACD